MEKRVRAMYFSGTGTTAKVTTAMAYHMWECLDRTEHKINLSGETDDLIDYVKAANINFTPKEARDEKYVFNENDIVVFGTPVIAGRVPNVLLKFLDTLEGGDAVAVPIVLYGNRNYDDALIELRNILESKGFHTIAAGVFIGEHSFSKVLAAGRPDNDDMEIAYGFAEKIAAEILDLMADGPEKALESVKAADPIEVKGEDPLRPYYQPRDRQGNHIDILKVKPKLNADRCDKCGICVEACPMGSIKEDEPGVVDGICIKCCGCVKKCPQEAMYFDDEGFLYHKKELELGYAERKEPECFI